MIKKIKNLILSHFRTIYLFEGTKNKKKINFICVLVNFKKFQSIKDKTIIDFINLKKKEI